MYLCLVFELRRLYGCHVVVLCLFNTLLLFIDNIIGFLPQVNMETKYSWMTRQGFSYTS